MSILINLGKYRFINFSTVWITASELCSFDASICNKVLREKFLAILLNYSSMLIYKDKRLNYDSIKWFTQRNCYVQSITCSNLRDFDLINTETTLFFHNLTNITIEKCSQN